MASRFAIPASVSPAVISACVIFGGVLAAVATARINGMGADEASKESDLGDLCGSPPSNVHTRR